MEWPFNKGCRYPPNETNRGGEPLMHPEFLEELFSECQDNYIHTAIETCGYVAWDKFEPVLRYTDLALYDVKHMDPRVFITGQIKSFTISVYRSCSCSKNWIRGS